jgi:uncharacterized protein (DUF1697 family)
MKTYIALFRGINVGGKNILPMQALVRLLENLGLQNVNTYIQSGNVVFQGEETDPSQLSERISAAIEADLGFKPLVLLRDLKELEEVVEANPFPQAESEPATLHGYFLASIPARPDLNALESLRSKNERFDLRENVFYLHAPDGIGRSKLAANIERLLGVSMTGRNWRTVQKIVAMARECNEGQPGAAVEV